MFVAKQLLKNYPSLLNDVYLSEEYYGENALHMACTAEDPSIVKWLLDEGADVHRRAYGSFFSCDDQKSYRRDAVEQEAVVVPRKTNFAGYVAWGEYPMNFAAVLSQVSATLAHPTYHLDSHQKAISRTFSGHRLKVERSWIKIFFQLTCFVLLPWSVSPH